MALGGEAVSHLACHSVVSANVVLRQTVQQYDVDVEWQAVQHYLRRNASKVVSPNLARPIVLGPNLVLPGVGLCRSSCSSCS